MVAVAVILDIDGVLADMGGFPATTELVQRLARAGVPPRRGLGLNPLEN